MDRTINYQITEEADGLRIEQFLRHQGYSYQNITQLKKMPESILKKRSLGIYAFTTCYWRYSHSTYSGK